MPTLFLRRVAITTDYKSVRSSVITVSTLNSCIVILRYLVLILDGWKCFVCAASIATAGLTYGFIIAGFVFILLFSGKYFLEQRLKKCDCHK